MEKRALCQMEVREDCIFAIEDQGHSPVLPKGAESRRVVAKGKFLFCGEEKFWVKGVTYGTFRPDAKGQEFHDPRKVEADLELMSRWGINALRTYTLPPLWFLDLAQEKGLKVMVGVPWEEHMAFLEERKRSRRIRAKVREGIRYCGDHPALLCYAVGNEIPAPIVRWHGKRAIETFLRVLYEEAKDEAPQALITYVNYPSTEYLEVDFFDLVCFNVYLESKERMEAYLARLHNLCGHKPLVMAELGLDSRRNGLEAQARSLDWQIRSAFASGCAGVFVFSWTDEWFRGGYDIEDWDFGLTTRDRKPKPALASVAKAFEEVPFPRDMKWPKVTAVVCSYNGSRTIGETLDAINKVDYPDLELLVVDDGSTDATPQIAAQKGARVITVPNGGLSRARNIGWESAQGEIVAYIDDDAYPDPHWLQYSVFSLLQNNWAGVGGPNIPPPGDGLVAECVSNSPGGPVHVLVSDKVAEHIPGCNMVFRREALEAIGGFDPRFRIAGDDVDLCWRLQEKGWTVGYAPGAVVWHHRRNSLKAYLRQQRNYGRAEALLERKWPGKYNVLGHVSWKGKLYGPGLLRPLPLGRWSIYHGTWGSAPFQSLYGPPSNLWLSLPMMPEWYMVLAVIAALGLMGLLWRPLAWAWVVFICGFGASIWQALLGAMGARFSSRVEGKRKDLVISRIITFFLFLAQPVARLLGRIDGGLTPWRRRGKGRWKIPTVRKEAIWSERWQSAEKRLSSLESLLISGGASVARGGDYDRWDLEVRSGLVGRAKVLLAIEEHGGGKQQILVRLWPKFSGWAMGTMSAGLILSALALLDGAWVAGLLLMFATGGVAWLGISDCGHAMGDLVEALRDPALGWKCD